MEPQRRPRLVERAPAEQRCGCRPQRAIALRLLCPHLATEGDELREVGDGRDVVQRRDARDAVRVEVVAEQQRRVVVGRREEARPAVVDEVALVDRLEPERVSVLAERREDGTAVALGARRSRQSAQSVLSAAASTAIVSQTSATKARHRSDCAFDLLVAVHGRGEERLELRRREVDALLEQVPEERAVALGVAAPARPRSCAPGRRVMKSVRSAPTRWTRPSGARPSSSRAARRSSSS